MAKVKVLEFQGGRLAIIHCPGCGFDHSFKLDVPQASNGAIWEWNGDVEKPTFTPSMLANQGTNVQCHSFVVDGKIRFLADCKHKLAGQTIDLPEMEE